MVKQNPPQRPQAKQHQKATQKRSKQKNKLDPGKKYCKNCQSIIPIHQKVCINCGHVHQMKKNKQDIMKNLNNGTPTLIKSIIENNDFNRFQSWSQPARFQSSTLIPKLPQPLSSTTQTIYIKNIPKQLSSSQQNSHYPTPSQQFPPPFKQSTTPNFYYSSTKKQISCLASSSHYLVFVQTLTKQPIGLDQKQLLTIQAYQLQYFNLVGVTYKGQSILHFTCIENDIDPTQYIFDAITIRKTINKMKIFSNILAMETGQSTLMIIFLPQMKKTTNPASYELSQKIQIIEPSPDRISSFQFLRSTVNSQDSKSSSIKMVVGTLYGRISIYNITKSGYTIFRFIPRAHNEMVTSIAECPLNTKSQVIFASGCYDGTLSIWDLHQKNPIFSYECSNKKIWGIYWDPGAKFLFVNRDQLLDNCLTICFYSITKIQTFINLSTRMQIRTVKNNKCKIITNHNYYSKYLPLLDPVTGLLKILQLQQLRMNSLKKKKPKKKYLSKSLFKINLKHQSNHQQPFQIQQISLNQQDTHQTIKQNEPNQQKKFPIFSDIALQTQTSAQYIYMSTYSGLVIAYKIINK